LLTRHVPLRDALRSIVPERVRARLHLLDRGLRRLGIEAPRLALAGLNPHAGENGLLGSEEKEILEPAVREAREDGLDVRGPLSPDTVFLRAAQGEFDGVLALYHDQAFIPVKLHAPGEGLTVLLGLPYLRVSPAHGTAFDIAGKGVADPKNLIAALEAAARWAPDYSRSVAESSRA
jgi:4-hydroxythreonine-4-phosphate dehydrogenase